ncbi:hypothetical protein ACP70R_006748 [Stipagrostis hirtigluma subsp. patula]
MEAATAQEHGWSSLPRDLLSLILERLPWSSHPSFAAACRHWSSAVTPFFPAWLTPLLLSAADVGSTNVRYYSPYHHKNFEVSTTLAAPGARICCAAGRHLTLCRLGTILEADLATGDVRELPPIKYGYFHFVVYDAGARRMFGVHTIGPPRTAVIVKGDDEDEDDDGEWGDWDYAAPLSLNSQMLEASPCSNPVIHGGLLYLLYDNGTLAVYDGSQHDDGWFEILDKPKSFGFQCEESYLFESGEGELMAALVGRRGTPVHVVKLNEQEMEWEEVESLDGRALFTGTLTTLLTKTGIEWMQNKIFLPRLHDWPETVHVDIVDRDGELAFVPTSTKADTMAANGESIWAYKLGSEESREFWGTERVDYGIWVDFSSTDSTF